MWGRWIALAAAVALSGGCDTLSKGPYAQANVQGGEGSRVWGRVTFHQPEGGTFIGEGTSYKAPVASAAANASTGKVYVRVDINGLPSNRKFGFHVHEKGDCSGDFSGAGGHFNPGGKPHGPQDSPDHHAGDLPNLESNGEGVANWTFIYRSADRFARPELGSRPRGRHPREARRLPHSTGRQLRPADRLRRDPRVMPAPR